MIVWYASGTAPDPFLPDDDHDDHGKYYQTWKIRLSLTSTWFELRLWLSLAIYKKLVPFEHTRKLSILWCNSLKLSFVEVPNSTDMLW